MSDDDPPLYAALQAMYDMTPRHELREDRQVTESYGTGRYGADDDHQGPTPDPLTPHPIETPQGPERPAELGWPFSWNDVSQQVDTEAAVQLPDPVIPGTAMCPCCGTVVSADRIRR